MTDHQAKVQETDRLQLCVGEEFNRIFGEVERQKVEVELQKVQLQCNEVQLRCDQMEMQSAAEIADRELRERELLERRAWRMTMAKYMSTGQYPQMDDSLRSQIGESIADDDNVLDSIHRL